MLTVAIIFISNFKYSMLLIAIEFDGYLPSFYKITRLHDWHLSVFSVCEARARPSRLLFGFFWHHTRLPCVICWHNTSKGFESRETLAILQDKASTDKCRPTCHVHQFLYHCFQTVLFCCVLCWFILDLWPFKAFAA